MTKKDYVEIARIFKDTRRFHSTYNKEGHATAKISDLEDAFVALLQSDNPRFDCERFLKACNR